MNKTDVCELTILNFNEVIGKNTTAKTSKEAHCIAKWQSYVLNSTHLRNNQTQRKQLQVENLTCADEQWILSDQWVKNVWNIYLLINYNDNKW